MLSRLFCPPCRLSYPINHNIAAFFNFKVRKPLFTPAEEIVFPERRRRTIRNWLPCIFNSFNKYDVLSTISSFPSRIPAQLAGFHGEDDISTLPMLSDDLSSLISIYLKMRVVGGYSLNSVVRKSTNEGLLSLIHQKSLNSRLIKVF